MQGQVSGLQRLTKLTCTHLYYAPTDTEFNNVSHFNKKVHATSLHLLAKSRNGWHLVAQDNVAQDDDDDVCSFTSGTEDDDHKAGLVKGWSAHYCTS